MRRRARFIINGDVPGKYQTSITNPNEGDTMNPRRKFIRHTAGWALVTTPLATQAATQVSYAEVTRATWRHGARPITDNALLLRELVRYATLAASSHNTQCWKFKLEPRSITLFPDLSRRCPAVDPDEHHLYVSLGCAAENLVLAAAAHGLQTSVSFDGAAGGSVRCGFEASAAVHSPLFDAIPQRQCTRADYDGQTIRNDALRLLEQAGKGDGVRVLLLTDKPKLEGVLEYVVQGNTAQMNDRAFVEELKGWIRFSESEALEKGDGLFTRASGNPVLPRWLGARLFDLVFTAKGENEKYAKQMRSSAGVAVFVSDADDRRHWVEVGRCYERFALQATALGLRNALMNQPVEVASIRPQFARFLGIGQRRPDLIARFGHGPTMTPSPRRPIESVILPG